MSKLMDEKKVKRILNIESFEKLDEKKANKFLDMLPKIDKSVAIKGLEQSGKVAIAMKNILTEYCKSITGIVKSADDSMKSVNDNYKNILQALIKKLDNQDISNEDSKYIIDKILEIQKRQSEENEKHRNFLLKAFSFIAILFLSIFGITNHNKK